MVQNNCGRRKKLAKMVFSPLEFPKVKIFSLFPTFAIHHLKTFVWKVLFNIILNYLYICPLHLIKKDQKPNHQLTKTISEHQLLIAFFGFGHPQYFAFPLTLHQTGGGGRFCPPFTTSTYFTFHHYCFPSCYISCSYYGFTKSEF